MTESIQRIADLAGNFLPAENIRSDEAGFTLDLGGSSLAFFSPGEGSYVGYCRARVADLGEKALPAKFATEALEGNFFWRGTDGAVVSFEADENAVYLTDRFDDGAFEDEADLSDFIDGFVRALDDWRARLDACIEEEGASAKEVL